MCGRFALGRDPEEIQHALQQQLFLNQDDGVEQQPEVEDDPPREATPEQQQEEGDAEAEAALAEAEGATPPVASSSAGGVKKGAEKGKGKQKEQSVAGTTELRIEWGQEAKMRYRKRYNISPKSYSPILRRANMSNTPSASLDEGTPGTKPAYKLDSLQWGLIPSWSKEPPSGPQHTINATCEKLFEGGGLWGSVRDKKRCVVVAEGFYEWKAAEGGGKGKQPHFVRMKEGKLMMMAGLWDRADYKGAFDEVSTFTIITVPVSKQLSFLHHRMPALLSSPLDVALWLSDKPWSPEIKSLVKTFPGDLEVYPVDPAVGKVQNDSADFILPLAKKKGTLSNMFAKQLANSPPKPSTSSSNADTKAKAESKSPQPSSSMMKKSTSASSSHSHSSSHSSAAASSSTSTSAPKPSTSTTPKPKRKKDSTSLDLEKKAKLMARNFGEVIELSSDDSEDEGDATRARKKVKTEGGSASASKGKKGVKSDGGRKKEEETKEEGGALDEWVKKG